MNSPVLARSQSSQVSQLQAAFKPSHAVSLSTPTDTFFDIRDAGIIFTLPLFIPYIYVIAYRKPRSFWQLLTVTVLVCFWLWRFFLRYQFCL